MKRKTYTDEFRAEVVNYSMEHGAAAAVEKYKLRRGMVYAWRRMAGVTRQEGGKRSNPFIKPPKGKSVADQKWIKVRHAQVYLRSALEEWGSVKSQHLASLAMIELKEAL